MKLDRASLRVSIALLLPFSLLTFAQAPSAHAATVTATGTDATICNQEVSDATNVTAVRLAGGDCVITFKSGSIEWIPASNLRRIRMLIVGAGGGGGGSYDTAGAGGGGAGQVLELSSHRITHPTKYLVAVGNGGTAGFHIARTNSLDAIGQAGTNTSISINSAVTFVAYAGGGGGSSRANGIGTASRVGGAAATISSGGIGGGPGGSWGSGGAGGGSTGAGANGSLTDPGRLTAAVGGTGTISDISGTSVEYGIGGAGGIEDGASVVSGTSASANSGSGGSGAGVFGAAYRNGGSGGSGVVIIRYSTTAPIFSNLSIAGNTTSAIIRQSNTISATVNLPSLLTFFAGKSRIAGCVSIPTSGSSTNNVATCSWKPTVKGAVEISVEASPVAAGIAGISTSRLNVGVVARTTRR